MQDESLSERILELERSLPDPQVRLSRAAVGRLLADEFVEFGSSGRCYTKAEALELLAGEAGSTRTCEVVDFSITMLAPNTALARYRIEVRESTGGEPSYSLRSSVWVFRSKRWQILFHQGTKTSDKL